MLGVILRWVAVMRVRPSSITHSRHQSVSHSCETKMKRIHQYLCSMVSPMFSDLLVDIEGRLSGLSVRGLTVGCWLTVHGLTVGCRLSVGCWLTINGGGTVDGSSGVAVDEVVVLCETPPE